MESGGRSNIQYKYTRRASKPGIVINDTTNINNPNIDGSDFNLQQQSFKRDPDQYMPIANVIRIMRRILPTHAKIADDAKETIQECVSEFISFITSEANEKCHREYRKTITPEDVLSAMARLGFENYIEPLNLFLNKYRAQDPERSSMNQMPFVSRGGPSFVQQSTSPQMARPRPRPPPFTMGYVPVLPPATAYSADRNNYVELPQMNEYFMWNNLGGSEGSSSSGFEFDPFAQFNK